MSLGRLLVISSSVLVVVTSSERVERPIGMRYGEAMSWDEYKNHRGGGARTRQRTSSSST